MAPLAILAPEVPLLTIVRLLEAKNIDDAIPCQRMVYYYFPCFNLTYVTTNEHDSIMLLKDSGREYKPQTPVHLQFENFVKKANRVKITYEDGSKYLGDIAMDSFYGFIRHGDGHLRDAENLLLSSGRYYQNEWVTIPDEKHCHNDNIQVHCINREDAYGFGTYPGCEAIHPIICKCCDKNHCDASEHFRNMKYVQIAHFAGVNKNHDDLISQLLRLFAKAYGSTNNGDAVIVRDRFFDRSWDRSTMIHNLFNREVIGSRVIADFKAIVKMNELIKVPSLPLPSFESSIL